MTVRIIQGDAMDVLDQLEPDSIDCVVTSPPYWRLRGYLEPGHADKAREIGMEPTLALHIERLVVLFEKVRRVLKPTGTVWLNYGDMYANDGKWGGATGGKHARWLHGGESRIGREKLTSNLKSKDLCMAASRLAIALQDAGWWVRSEIIWDKPNPLPAPVTDRPNTSHEKVYLLTKCARYYYDAAAVRQPSSDNTHARVGKRAAEQKPVAGWATSGRHEAADWNQGRTKESDPAAPNSRPHKVPGVTPKSQPGGSGVRANEAGISTDVLATRNLRTVWRIASEPFAEAHFATFPTALAELCIKAGSSEHGCCPSCGAPWRRIAEKEAATGWAPTCDCPVTYPLRQAVILDPFGGSGTVGLAADRLGRDAVLIELVEGYANDMAPRRISGDAPLFDPLGERAR